WIAYTRPSTPGLPAPLVVFVLLPTYSGSGGVQQGLLQWPVQALRGTAKAAHHHWREKIRIITGENA
ncbi:unnamed protein product, partial [Urochloa humidicola]